MRSGSEAFVRRVDEHVVVIDSAHDTIEVRRSASDPTPEDTLLDMFACLAARRLELYVARDGSHRLVLAVGAKEGIDLGAEATRTQSLALGREIGRVLMLSIDIRDGAYLDEYQREHGLLLTRIRETKEVIEAELVDAIDPRDELSPWTSDRVEVDYDPIERGNFTVDDLLIEMQTTMAADEDGPFTQPRVRTAPEVEAVYPLPDTIDPPALPPHLEAQVRANHRPPRQPYFEHRNRSWLLKLLASLV